MIAKTLTCLTTVDVRNCHRLTDHAAFALATLGARLVTLYMSETDISDAAATAIAKSCPCLGIMCFNGCQNIGDDGVAALAGIKTLHEIGLIQTAVTDTGILAVVAGCARLATLSIDGCEVTDISLLALATGSKCLKDVEAWDCEQVTAAAKKQLREAGVTVDGLTLEEFNARRDDATS